MQLNGLDHVNVRTAQLDRMIEWYGDVLDMPTGDRPAFDFPGAWLYCAGKPMIHLIGIKEPAKVSDLRIEHFAIGGSGLAAFIARLKAKNVGYELGRVEDFGILQVNIWDPDDNHIHVDFPLTEAAELEDR